jgi:hypothetical protein
LFLFSQSLFSGGDRQGISPDFSHGSGARH